MKNIINLYKPIGMTPLQALEKFRFKNKEYHGKKMSYPGRLDPMAEGVLLVLVDEENKKMKQYMKLDKEYEADILLGFETDSHDILGMPKKGERKEINMKSLKKKIKNFKGNYNMEVPVYSSIRVKGKALFNLARRGKIPSEIPKLKVKIKDIFIDYIYEITGKKLLKLILRKINLIEGDFRQEEIKMKWNLLLENSEEKFKVVKLFVRCSSGTYIRALARDIGKDFNGGILLRLKRTKVGKYEIRDSVRM